MHKALSHENNLSWSGASGERRDKRRDAENAKPRRVTRTAARGLVVFVLWFATSALGTTFTASLDRTAIVLGEQVTLTLTFDGTRPQQISELPAIEGLRVASAVSQGMNSSIGPNGATTIYTYSLALEPTRVGEFVIPSFHAKANGENLASPALQLKVAAEDPSAPPASFAAKQIFLWPVLPKKELFAGEPMIGEIRLYVRNDIRGIGNLQIPLAGDGLRFSKLVEGQRFQRRIGGNPFTVLPYSFALTPVKAGELNFGPINSSVVLNPPNMMDIESFFGGGSRSQPVNLTLDAVPLHVSPLPSEGVPADFSGAIGRFSMTATAGPTNVAVGDPITIRVQIAGEGQFDSLNLPDHSDWRDFKIYPPTSKVETTGEFGIQGAKTFEQVVIPQNADLKTLPAFSFSYFDPETKSYRTLQQPPLPLIVRPGGSLPAPSVAANHNSGDTTPPRARDIVPIKQRLGPVTKFAPPLLHQPWFLSLQSVPLLVFIGAVTWRKRNETLANNPRLRRQRQVAQVVREGLGELKTAAAANNSDAFFATVFRLLQEQLGERLDVPASSITEAVIDERLRPKGVPDATLAGLHELFQTCNLARYAPIKSSQELAAIIPKVESTLSRLREVKL